MSETYLSVPLTEQHQTNFFECGEGKLDNWLDTHALPEQNVGKSRTHVWVDQGGEYVVGYYTLSQTTVRETDDEPGLFKKIRPPKFRGEEAPGILIGKFALDQSLQRQQLSLDLLADAYLNAYDAVRLVGGVFLVIEPKQNRERLRKLYETFGFLSIEGSNRMFLNFEDFNKGTPFDA
ncbi:hypothetical protein QT969_20825 [Rhodococcus sp. CSLK01-03]|uniref:N-acetyltransferase domain-containing protein n=1 Tax=Rhodococcus indonesiensis TaxID=3055869 RepID=A0ABT7RSV6_9NOCA|nr:hypothetical protein [Rhodococcus indonesiensis]MDM7490735.1 hypothetical protein [Rhodococcus indonesiensis]